jgi:hypothetical protein
VTTASVYYDDRNLPDFILIDGDRADVPRDYTAVDGDWRLRRVDRACAQLGWRVAPGAKIVRQADGRGTVLITPTALRPGLPPRTPPAANPVRDGVAYVQQDGVANADGSYDLTVAVDGRRTATTTAGLIDDLDPKADKAAREAVDATLTAARYVRTGELVNRGLNKWTCAVAAADELTDPDPVWMAFIAVDDNDLPLQVEVPGAPTVTLPSTTPLTVHGGTTVDVIDQALLSIGYRRTGVIELDEMYNEDPWTRPGGRRWTCPVRNTQWQDHPTLVRMDDTTATMLTGLADRLSIPADELACTWIRRAAADARDRHDRFMSPGYIADHSRITGWNFDGSPRMR